LIFTQHSRIEKLMSLERGEDGGCLRQSQKDTSLEIVALCFFSKAKNQFFQKMPISAIWI